MKLSKETQKAVDRLAELEVIKKTVLKPFYEEHREITSKLQVGKVYQASNGVCLRIDESDGHFTYNEPFKVSRTKVTEDDRNTLAAKDAVAEGFEPSIPNAAYAITGGLL